MMKKRYICIVFVFVVSSGCHFFKPRPQEEDLFIKAAALRRLSAAVESSARYKDVPADVKNYELLKKATENNPQLLNGFEDFSLKAIIVNRHSIVLLCDRKEQNALIEDTGCTGEVDVLHWQNESRKPCDFTVDVSAVCDK